MDLPAVVAAQVPLPGKRDVVNRQLQLVDVDTLLPLSQLGDDGN